MRRFNRASFIFVFALLLLCSVPLQALAAPNLVLTARSVTYQGSGTYRCTMRITNTGISGTGTNDVVRLYANGTLHETFTLSGSYVVSAGDYEDFYVDYNLGSASSAVVRVELSSTVSAYATQSVTANIPSDSGHSGGDGGGGGCNAGVLGLSILGLAVVLPIRGHRRKK